MEMKKGFDIFLFIFGILVLLPFPTEKSSASSGPPSSGEPKSFGEPSASSVVLMSEEGPLKGVGA